MLLPRSVDAHATLLGILKAGAAYVPLELDWPADRVAYVLQDSSAEVLLTTFEFAERHAAFDGAIVLAQLNGITAAGWSSH